MHNNAIILLVRDKNDRYGRFFMSDIVKFDAQYSQWIKDISARFMQSQVKAACKVNVELLKFYWNLGRDISVMNAANNYGTNFYKK